MAAQDLPDGPPPERSAQGGCPQTRARIAEVMAFASRRPRLRAPRGWLRALLGLALVLALALGGAGYAVFRLQSERNSAFLREHFTDAVLRALGPGHALDLQSARLAFSGMAPRFELGGLVVRNTQTGGEVQLEQASFALAPLSLLRFSPEAKVVRFSDLRLILPNTEPGATTLQASEVLALLRGTLGAIHIAIAGEDPAFSTLRSIDGEKIAIFRRNEGGGLSALQTGLGLRLFHQDKGFVARVEKPGVDSLTMTAGIIKGEGGPQVVLETGELRAGTLFTLVGAAVAGIDPDLALNLRLASRLDGGGALSESVIGISARGGRIELPDEDMVPFQLDEGSIELAVKPGEAPVEVRRLRVRFNETDVLARGTLTPTGNALAVSLKAEKALLDRLSPEEEVVELDSAELEGEISGDMTSFRVDRLDIAEDEGRARLTGRYSIAGDKLIATSFEGGGFSVRKALRIWPVWVAPELRRWLIAHLKGGKLTAIKLSTHLEGEALRAALSKRPVPDEAIAGSFRVEKAELVPLDDALPLKEADAGGTFSGRRMNVTVDRGQIRTVLGSSFAVGPVRMAIADTARHPALLEMSLPANGRLDALVAYLAAPSLRAVTGIPSNLAVTQGQFDAVAQIVVPVGRNAQAKDTKIDIKADLKSVVVENVIKGEKLEASSLSMLSKAGNLGIKGDAKLFGVPGQVDFKVDAKGAQAQVKLTLDDAALAKKGIDLKPTLSGPLGVTASLGLSKPDAPVEFDIDLARARVNAPSAGIAKAAGAAGRAKFSLKSDEAGHHIEGIETDFGTVSLRGKAVFAKDGGFLKADLSSFKLSSGDNAHLNAERAGRGYKLNLRGNSFDLRPFLRSIQSGRIESGGTPVDFDLDLATTVLVGFGGELMGGAELNLARRSGQVTQLNLKGSFGRAGTRISSSVQGKNTQLTISSQDGGALARFLDLYSRAYGGQLQADVTLLPNEAQQGVVQMREFTLRGEAGLRSVSPNAKDGQAVLRGTDDVPFTKLRAEFTRKPGRLEVHDGVMWGPQVGGTMEGLLDYAGDRVSIKGTFVPAYALNNLFAQVPILGPFLGGGQYEGLFAVPFIITGKASAPELKMNPVSAIAPGFLRKLFEIRRESQ